MRTQLGRGLSAVIASRTGDRARRRRLGAAAVVVLLVTAGATARAHAYVIEGQPWPGHLITYHNTSRADAGAVAAAARDWNHSGAHLRLVSVPAGRAEVTISKMPRGFTTTHLPGGHTINSDALGYATLGHTHA